MSINCIRINLAPRSAIGALIATCLLVASQLQLSNCQDHLTAKNTTITKELSKNNTATTQASVLPNTITTNSTTSTTINSKHQETNSTLPLVEALSEQLVKQSNLQAEESRQSDASASFLPPPANWTPQVSSPDHNQQQQPHQRQNQPPVSYKGGSGNAYMSMSRDGSNRYEFGYDTHGSSSSLSPVADQPSTGGKKARLMREESRLEDGTVIGRYGYTDPFNVFRVVQYVAGPDGYFATEDVGAMQSPSGKFQLNKQLHRALEQARRRRRRRQQDSDSNLLGSTVEPHSVMIGHANEQQPPPQQVATSTTKELVNSSIAAAPAATTTSESLAQSGSHQSIRYSSKINHVVGSNGVSYATAFRPVLIPQRQSPVSSRLVNFEPTQSDTQRQQHVVPQLPMMLSYQPVKSPNPADLLRRQHQSFEQQQAKLRSQLPAPIYSPHSFGQGHNLEEHAIANEEPQFTPNVASHAQSPVTLPPVAPSNQWSWSSAVSHNSNNNNHQQQQQQQAPLPVARGHRYQESSAWSLLNNNYNQDQATIIIDHSDTSGRNSKPMTSAQITPQIGANFEREAVILRSLQAGNSGSQQVTAQQWQPVSLNATHLSPSSPPVPTIQQTYANSPTLTFGMAYGSSGSQSSTSNHIRINHNDHGAYSTRHFEFGKRTGFLASGNSQTPSSFTASGSNYEFDGLALQNFNPPLYHPEVHQTSPLAVEPFGSADSKPVVYSSTILHNEMAAERHYRPERLSGSGSSNHASETLQLVASEQQNSTMASAENERQQQQQQTKTQVASVVEVPPANEPVRYATRLSAHTRSAPVEELDVDDSEQVNNYLSVSNVTRAKMPNRQKKISSIFKSRTSNLNGTNGEDPSTGRIRLPVPVNAKRKFGSSLRAEPPVDPPVESAIVVDTQQDQPRGLIVEMAEDSSGQVDHENQPQVNHQHQQQKNPSASQRKFGRGNNVNERQQEVLGTAEVFETQLSAKRRPILRGEQPLQHQPIGNKYQLARQEQVHVQYQTASSTTPSPASVPTATIIDATDQLKSGLDKELYEKIVKIQQEIARMSKSANPTANLKTSTTSTTTSTTKAPLQTSTSTSSTTTTEAPTTTTSSTTTTTSTTPVPTTRLPVATTTTTSTRQPSVEPIVREIESTNETTLQVNAEPEPVVAITTPSLITTTTTTARPTTTVPPAIFSMPRGSAGLGPSSSIGTGGKRLFPARKLITTTSRPTTTTKSTKNLSGQLVKADTMSAQDDLLQRLTLDMDAFDSTRGDTVVANKAVVSSTTTKAPLPITTSIPTTQRLRPSLVRMTTTTSTSTTTTTTTTTAAPTSPPTTTTATPTATASSTAPTSTAFSREQEPTLAPVSSDDSSQSLTLVTPTTIANFSIPPLVFSTTTQIPSLLVNAEASTTSAPVVQSNFTSITTTTTTTTPSVSTTRNNPTTTTLRPSTRRTTQHPRFGRLVIKRGDKVVARYNGSEPIPDSVIPVAGSESDVIMPDMPRLGMRRTVKKRFNQTLLTVTSTSTSTTTTTVAPTSLPATLSSTQESRQQEQQEQQQLAANLANFTLPLLLNSTTQELNKTSIEAAIISASPATIAALTRSSFRSGGSRRTLSRGVRSHDISKLEGSLADGDLMFSESNSEPDMIEFGLPDLRKVAESLTKHKTTSTTTTTSAPVALARRQTSTGGLNWSARLRDGRPQPSDKIYDSKEDLRRLVEKISSIEEGNMTLVIQQQQQQQQQPSADVNNQQQPAPVTTTTTSISSTTPEPSSSSLPNLQQLPVSLNSSSLAQLPAHEKSESKSVSYTVTMSPELEKRWTEMKPLGESQRKPLGLIKPQDVRVDSRGFIHVRHNQSVTIHVDIEPPRRLPVTNITPATAIATTTTANITTNITATTPNAASGPSTGSQQTVRRLTGRDTVATMNSNNRSDLQRLHKDHKQQVALSRPTRSDGVAPMKEQVVVGAPVTDLKPSSSSRGGEQAKRKPNLLCVEVDPNDSEPNMRKSKPQ